MNTLDYIKRSIEVGSQITIGLLDDMQDAPLTQPTSKGGNHPLWILGHLAYSEANIVEHIIKGNENPLIEWKEIFGSSSEPTTNAEDYPSWDSVRGKYEVVHAETMKFLNTLSDDDLETPSKNCPPGREAFFGTIGGCCIVLAMHPVMHRGQIADARRMADRPPLIG